MAFRKSSRGRRSNKPKVDLEKDWTPKTELGRKVKNHEVNSIEEIYTDGKQILESEIVDFLLPDLEEQTLEIRNTQRMTDCGRKIQFRAVVLVGDKKGHVGIGTGKSEEVRPAIETAAKNARRNIIAVPRGSGSWEDPKKAPNSIPIRCIGKNGSVEVLLKPAPRGVGLASNPIVRKVLVAAGVKNVWSFSRGHTRNIYNMAMATLKALDSLNNMRYHGNWSEMGAEIVEKSRPKEVVKEEQKEPALKKDEIAA
jgi:small subunit ribosomal protein S5